MSFLQYHVVLVQGLSWRKQKGMDQRRAGNLLQEDLEGQWWAELLEEGNYLGCDIRESERYTG